MLAQEGGGRAHYTYRKWNNLVGDRRTRPETTGGDLLPGHSRPATRFAGKGRLFPHSAKSEAYPRRDVRQAIGAPGKAGCVGSSSTDTTPNKKENSKEEEKLCPKRRLRDNGGKCSNFRRNTARGARKDGGQRLGRGRPPTERPPARARRPAARH
ncbi:hypothetical protein EVAR_104019_1 [Eumeta japonica]|uniref:Uncharacterized protein n=1 Tax=Eumeta variegata TaxID=151549 RepID=A0A4C1Y0H4_EUMVA|nr:hypothetical protein EVAR_104019_1 [Eumeta japonica]